MNDIIKTLVAVANACDENGLRKEADELDALITKIAHRPIGQPYVDQDGLKKQKYVDGKGRVYTVVLTPPEEEEQGWLEWMREKAGDKVRNLFDLDTTHTLNDAIRRNLPNTDEAQDTNNKPTKPD